MSRATETQRNIRAKPENLSKNTVNIYRFFYVSMHQIQKYRITRSKISENNDTHFVSGCRKLRRSSAGVLQPPDPKLGKRPSTIESTLRVLADRTGVNHAGARDGISFR